MSPPLYMDAVITPHRSLSAAGFTLLMAGLVLVSGVVSILFYTAGAKVVPVFLGLDVLGLYVAFRLNYRSAGTAERVQVTAEEVRVLHERGRLRRTVWRSPTAFTRVDLEDGGEHEARVRVRLSDRRLTVGAALSPAERVDFAEALRAAVNLALSERW